MSAVLSGYIYPARMPWVQILKDLHAAGCTNYRIAAIFGTTVSSVDRWENGSEPRHSYGTALLELHEQICPNLTQQRHRESVPRV